MTLDHERMPKEMAMFNLTRSLDRNADRTPHEDAVIVPWAQEGQP